jgi:hypothetical protein
MSNPSEITLKQWFIEQAERECSTVAAVHGRYYRAGYCMNLRRVNQRVVFVVGDATRRERSGTPLKQWLAREAQRLGTTAKAVYYQWRRGKYQLAIKRINRRIVLVQEQ